MRKFGLTLLLLLLHIAAGGIILYFWKPIADWYLSKIPALGVDLYLSATYVAYHLRHFSLPFDSFKDIWFAGYPLIADHPQLPFYLMFPFGYFFGLPAGVQVFAMAVLFILVIFCYLLFFQLSKNHGLSILLSILILLSPNIYGAAIWAGSMPYFASQAIFPLGLFFGVKYLENSNIKNLALVVFVTGVGILIHALGILTFLIPSLVMIILISGFLPNFQPQRVVKHLFFYLIGLILASFSFTGDFVITRLAKLSVPIELLPSTSNSGGSGLLQSQSTELAKFYQEQIKLLFTQTNDWIFTFVVIGFILTAIAFVFSKKKMNVLISLAFILIAAYTAFHPVANLGGLFNFLRHDPYRAFWTFPIAVAAAASALWGFFFSTVAARLDNKFVLLKASKVIFSLVITLALIGFSYSVYKQDIQNTIETLNLRSEYSSAYPEGLSISLDKKELEDIKGQIVPSFIDPNNKNFRLYSADATVNIWWNSFFQMPLARGYVDPPIGTDVRGGFFWLDIAIANDSLTRDFKVSENTAYNNALFLIDWYGIGFFEGGRLSSKGPSPGPSSYLVKNNVFDAEEQVTIYGAVLKWQTASGKPEVHEEVPQYLRYFKISDQFTSPILSPTNSSVVAIFSSFPGYEDMLRILGSENLNSQKLIPVYAGEYIDDLKFSELKNFDALFIHQYKTHNSKKAFEQLEKYVKDGGKIFIDTGAEAKESNSSQLPEPFPFTASERSGLGKEWDLLTSESSVLKDVDISQFGPPIFNQNEWKLTAPRQGNKLREGSNVILTHKGLPILIERNLGMGKVVWSGLNLPYHYNQYKSNDEAKLFVNILSKFASLEEKEQIAASTQWQKPEKVVIKTSEKTRGILFKEQGYSGWSAHLTSEGGRKLPIYLTGPTYPGFMYVPLADAKNSQVTLTFSYGGTFKSWFVVIINLLALLFLLDLGLLNGKFLGKITNKIWLKSSVKISRWWEKEEE